MGGTSSLQYPLLPAPFMGFPCPQVPCRVRAFALSAHAAWKVLSLYHNVAGSPVPFRWSWSLRCGQLVPFASQGVHILRDLGFTSLWVTSEHPPVYRTPQSPERATKPSLPPCLIFSLNFTYPV